MELNVVQGAIQASQADTLILNLFAGNLEPAGATAAVDALLGGAIRELIQLGDLTGKAGEVAVVYPHGKLPAKRVLIVGLGPAGGLSLEGVRRAAAAAVKRARDLNAQQVATVVHGFFEDGLDPAEAAKATVEGSLLALYQYQAPGHGSLPSKQPGRLDVVELDAAKVEAVKAGVRAGSAGVAGARLARDLTNMPANLATPSRLAEAAKSLADQYGLNLTVGDRAWAAERHMGGFLGVAQGTREEPRFIVLEYNAGQPALDTIVVVGKGLTFDSGGISIKPVERMGEMKSDMAGAAAMLGTLKAAAMLELPLHLVGIAPCTDNMPGGGAYHPSDVLTISNGKTVEIITTDAEGRLVLADGLVFAQQYHPKAVIDLATLTGSCVIALGEMQGAGLFCNDDELRERLLRASDATRERLWPMPLWEEYKNSIKSNVADLKNSGGKHGGVGTSAMFLKEFTDYPWAHVDMAGMALAPREDGYITLGGTGFGVRLLVEFLTHWR